MMKTDIFSKLPADFDDLFQFIIDPDLRPNNDQSLLGYLHKYRVLPAVDSEKPFNRMIQSAACNGAEITIPPPPALFCRKRTKSA